MNLEWIVILIILPVAMATFGMLSSRSSMSISWVCVLSSRPSKSANGFYLTIDTTGYIAILLQPADQIY